MYKAQERRRWQKGAKAQNVQKGAEGKIKKNVEGVYNRFPIQSKPGKNFGQANWGVSKDVSGPKTTPSGVNQQQAPQSAHKRHAGSIKACLYGKSRSRKVKATAREAKGKRGKIRENFFPGNEPIGNGEYMKCNAARRTRGGAVDSLRRVGETQTDCTGRVLGAPARKLGLRCEKVPSYKRQVPGAASNDVNGSVWSRLIERRWSQKAPGRMRRAPEKASCPQLQGQHRMTSRRRGPRHGS
ncbi:hypothetical protein C8J57DRAFT_1229417 [Mycena rebaudengoi]|nr:hypothetical protein C8J57DRAFT_1229417 [Mycena rebaudengoi]